MLYKGKNILLFLGILFSLSIHAQDNSTQDNSSSEENSTSNTTTTTDNTESTTTGTSVGTKISVSDLENYHTRYNAIENDVKSLDDASKVNSDNIKKEVNTSDYDKISKSDKYWTTPYALELEETVNDGEENEKELGFTLSFDNLKFIRGDKRYDRLDDYLLSDIAVKVYLPWIKTSNKEVKNYLEFELDHYPLIARGDTVTRGVLKSPVRIFPPSGCEEKKPVEIWICNKRESVTDGSEERCPGGDSTWIDVDCEWKINKYSITGYVQFDPEVIKPVDSKKGNVKAYFTFRGQDGFISDICFNQAFYIGEVKIDVEQAVIDFSSTVNAKGFKFPSDNYWTGTDLQTAWKGIYFKKVKATLPEKWKICKNSGNDFKKGLTLTGSNLYFDFTNGYKFSGKVTGDSLFKCTPDWSPIGLEVDTASVEFLKSKFKEGRIKGKVYTNFLQERTKDFDKTYPGSSSSSTTAATSFASLNDKLAYQEPLTPNWWQASTDAGNTWNGYIAENTKSTDKASQGESNGTSGASWGFDVTVGFDEQKGYSFMGGVSIETDKTYDIPFTSAATVTLKKGSSLDLAYKEDKVSVKLNLNGSLNMNDHLIFEGVNFEGLKLQTQKPYIDIDYFSLTGIRPIKLGPFSVTLNELGWSKNVNSDDQNEIEEFSSEFLKRGSLIVDGKVALMSGNSTLAADLGMGIEALSKMAENEDMQWKPGNVNFNKLGLDVDFSSLHFKGSLKKYKNDSKFGNGISGDLLLTLKEMGFGIDASAVFGSVNGFKYWYTSANADFSGSHILLFPPGVFLRSLKGGAYYHMKPNDMSTTPAEGPIGTISLSRAGNYTPDKTIGFGFIAGVGAYFMQKNLVSANAEFEMNFNTNWGVNYISLKGIAAVMDALSDDDTNAKSHLAGWLHAKYYAPEKTFDCDATVVADFGKIIEGQGSMNLHIDPDEWYLWLGTRKVPNYLSFMNIVKCENYFMLGKIPTSLTPLNEKMAAKLKVKPSGAIGADDDLYNGKGMAFAVAIDAGAKVGLPLDLLFAEFRLAAGTDVMITSTTSCGNWRAYGDAYVSAYGGLGARVPHIKWCKWYPCIRMNKVMIFDSSVDAIMQAQIPKPLYLSGSLDFECHILFIPLPEIHAKFHFGQSCP